MAYMADENHYRAYLLRLQRGQGQPHWRVTLQNAQTGEALRFATEQALVNHLLSMLNIDGGSGKDSDPVNHTGYNSL
jgi:hypothetical protein